MSGVDAPNGNDFNLYPVHAPPQHRTGKTTIHICLF